jgi:CubicO group peptidase (beta-lactamase class C family)
MREPDVERAAGLMRASNATAQLCVLRHGQVVLDRQNRCGPEALFLLLSASKPFIAVQVHLLAERGAISLDAPVAAYWPEYARNGKGAVTIRHVLAHRAGVPFASGSELGDALTMTRARRAVRQAQAARPRWPAGQVVAYHPMTYGFILGEVIRRVTGQAAADQIAADILGPLGLSDTHLGIATRPSSEGLHDRVLGRPVRWAHGFILATPGQQTPMGRLASPQAFGHAASGSVCSAWADPACAVVLAYLTDRLVTRSDLGARHQCEVSDAIRTACASGRKGRRDQPSGLEMAPAERATVIAWRCMNRARTMSWSRAVRSRGCRGGPGAAGSRRPAAGSRRVARPSWAVPG